ncbi:hypothetical protein [Noviherbaspirillum sp. UKPF54]|uniref:hypothetical protein n=1 Tax=Noviherbaspirillum sp. UKPF54 TaxID=2601898 RepID=UPI0011B17763|nr:hypothetical protein [Noviherbaspirillum sp. UKPF54]QDZ29257.1 hypothetical protein FAY22_15565 [Noviherbaspirillum sp. UKPF54]
MLEEPDDEPDAPEVSEEPEAPEVPAVPDEPELPEALLPVVLLPELPMLEPDPPGELHAASTNAHAKGIVHFIM